MITFTPELRQQWLDALRSGDFEQGKMQLVLGDEFHQQYCCLGVLGTLIGCARHGDNDMIAPDSDFTIHGTLVKEYDNGAVRSIIDGLDFGTQVRLAEMNDGNNDLPEHNFLEIADYIETNIPAVEVTK